MVRELGGDAPLVENEANKKRLVREDEEGGSDEDEDEKRIVFSGVKHKSQRQKIAEEIGEWRRRGGAGNLSTQWMCTHSRNVGIGIYSGDFGM